MIGPTNRRSHGSTTVQRKTSGPRSAIGGRWAGILMVVLLGVVTTVPESEPARAQGPSESLTRLDFLARFGGHSTSLVARGERIFLAVDRRIEIYDSADPRHPRLLRSSDVLPQLLLDLEIDESEGEAMEPAGGTPDPRLIALSAAGLHVFDAGDRGGSKPQTWRPIEGALQMAVAGGKAFVARGNQIVTVDLRERDRPDSVWTADTNEPIHQILAFGGRVYAARAKALHALHYDEAAGWVGLGTVHLPERITALAGEGDGQRLYVAAINAGAWALDVGDPADMQVLGHLASRGVVDIQVAGPGTLALAQYQDRLDIADFRDPTSPRTLAALEISTSGILDLGMQGGTLVLTSLEHGLRLIDLRQPESPDLLWRADPAVPSDLRAVARQGRLLHVGGGEGGYRLLDATQPARPRLLARLDIPDIQRIAATGSRALLITSGDAPGLRSVDLSDPERVLVSAPLLDDSHDLVVRGHFAYVAGEIATLSILDLSQATPLETFRYAGPPGRRLATNGRRIFVMGDYSVSEFTIDSHDPGDAGFVATTPFDAPLAALAMNDNSVYISDRNGRLRTYSDRSFPRLDATLELPDSLLDLAVEDVESEDRLYGVGPQAGLVIMDFGDDPGAPRPRVLGYRPQPGALSLNIADGLLHAVSPAAGLHVYRLSGQAKLYLPGLSRP